MIEKPIEADVSKYNFIIRAYHASLSRQRIPYRLLVKYRMVCTIMAVGLSVGCSYALIFKCFIKLNTFWWRAIEVSVVKTGALSAIYDFKKSDGKGKE